MEVSEEKIAQILEMYKPECKYLVRADVSYPKAEGFFKVENSYYVKDSFEHVTSIEAQLCLNQLSYVAFGEWIMENRFKGLELSFEKYLQLMRENMFIVDSHIKFKKPINHNFPIKGIISVEKVKALDRIYFTLLEYILDGGKSEGTMGFALKLK